jgi:hypothetical protein
MAAQRLIVAIGRIERALSRVERLPDTPLPAADNELAARHEKLKAETREAIKAIDDLLGGAA